MSTDADLKPNLAERPDDPAFLKPRIVQRFEPLVSWIKTPALGSHVLHTDDTPVNIRDAHATEQLTGRMWTDVDDEPQPFTLFEFTRARTDGPARALANVKGDLQAAPFSGDDGLSLDARGAIVEVARATQILRVPRQRLAARQPRAGTPPATQRDRTPSAGTCRWRMA